MGELSAIETSGGGGGAAAASNEGGGGGGGGPGMLPPAYACHMLALIRMQQEQIQTLMARTSLPNTPASMDTALEVSAAATAAAVVSHTTKLQAKEITDLPKAMQEEVTKATREFTVNFFHFDRFSF